MISGTETVSHWYIFIYVSSNWTSHDSLSPCAAQSLPWTLLLHLRLPWVRPTRSHHPSQRIITKSSSLTFILRNWHFSLKGLYRFCNSSCSKMTKGNSNHVRISWWYNYTRLKRVNWSRVYPSQHVKRRVSEVFWYLISEWSILDDRHQGLLSKTRRQQPLHHRHSGAKSSEHELHSQLQALHVQNLPLGTGTSLVDSCRTCT